MEDCQRIDKNGQDKEHYRGWFNVIEELYNDPMFSNVTWWLDNIFRKFLKEKDDFYEKFLKTDFSEKPSQLINNMKISGGHNVRTK